MYRYFRTENDVRWTKTDVAWISLRCLSFRAASRACSGFSCSLPGSRTATSARSPGGALPICSAALAWRCGLRKRRWSSQPLFYGLVQRPAVRRLRHDLERCAAVLWPQGAALRARLPAPIVWIVACQIPAFAQSGLRAHHSELADRLGLYLRHRARNLDRPPQAHRARAGRRLRAGPARPGLPAADSAGSRCAPARHVCCRAAGSRSSRSRRCSMSSAPPSSR